MDSQIIPYHSVKGITFNIYSSKEIRKLSVLEITNLKTFDDLGHATAGGLHDPLLGPTEANETCSTCRLTQFYCSGHVGHISLPLPVFNPFLLGTLHKLLRGTCFNCHGLLAMPVVVQLTLAQLHALDYGLVGISQEMEEMVSEYLTEGTRKVIPLSVVLEIKRKFTEHVEKALKDLDLEEARKSSSVKNVVECRQRIIKNFMSNHLMRSQNKCYYCHSRQKKIALYNFMCLVFRNSIKEKNKTSDSIYFRNESESEAEETENFDMSLNSANLSSQSLLTALEARDHLRKLWEKEKPLLQHLFGILDVAGKYYECPTDVFFIEDHLVTPTRYRPISFLKGKKYENPQTAALKKVLQYSIIVREILNAMKKGKTTLDTEDENMKSLLSPIKGRTLTEKLYNARNYLQLSVNAVADVEMDKLSKEKYPGKKQIIEKKEGVFRKHMMGKRVDYAARSVISPDPYIMMDEVGIPEYFAKKLTYPQPVTPWNVRELRQIVINGPDVYPGAVLVKRDDGLMVRLSATNRIQREAIAKKLLTPDSSGSMKPGMKESKIVYRHLRTGDCLLLNRQPTLHKPSIMAHRARVLPKEQTLRLHYANCKTYNADFDGDEMNAHLPQSELARAEGYYIASVNYQYLVPKDGTPLSGLIQDHVIAGSLLSMRGRFFYREEYHELVFGALTFIQRPLKLLPPCILKPEVLWSGKQVISTIIINIIPLGKPAPTVEGKAKITSKNWQTAKSRTWNCGGSPFVKHEMSESEVIIQSGELLCGVLDKAHYGPTPYGLVHCCYELYGGKTSMILLTSLTRLFTHFLTIHRAFTLGVEDILVTSRANKRRRKIMKSAKRIGDKVVAEAFDIADSENKEEIKDKYQRAHLDRDDRGRKQLDAAMKSHTDRINNEINQVCIPDGLLKKFPMNNLQLMVQSGAKGSSVNAMQISCLLGQIELEGKRVPLMPSGRSAPSFRPYDTSPRAGGFVDGRFLTGIRPQEYFFHCMAGREGLVDTAVKTSRSGYLQRCLIKHLEGLMVNYDLTVRDSDGSVIQFQYGEDGLDIPKMQMLKKDQFSTLIKNYKAAVQTDQLEELTKKLDIETAKHCRKKMKKWRKKHGNSDKHHRVSGFTVFSTEFLQQLRAEHPGRNERTGCEYAKEKLCKLWHELDADTKYRYNRHWVKCPDPLISQLNMDNNFGSISEKLDSLIESYISDNPDNLLEGRKSCNVSSNVCISRSEFRYMMYLKYLNALAQPGEAVGLLAAQSVGEPSTQMTLNTFHFAGRGDMNVTLGIPRLKEILTAASSNIATPSMELPLLPTVDAEAKANELRIKFTAVTLAQVLEKVNVSEHLKIKGKMCRFRQYYIRFKFLPHKAYRNKFFVTPSSILKFMETSFIKKLCQGIKKKIQHMASSRLLTSSQKRYSALLTDENDESVPAPNDNDEGESSDDGEGDGDTTSAKQKTRHDQEQEYDVDDMEENQSGSDDISVNDKEDGEKTETEDESQSILPPPVQQNTRSSVRIDNVLKLNPYVTGYKFDAKHQEWCEVELQLDIHNSKIDMATLVEEEAHKALVHETPGITRAFLVEDGGSKNGSQKMLKTEGVNIQEVFKYENVIDINRIYSNDIHAIARTYGIEAANRAIVKEVTNVFGVYGITVDPRHLLLIADYMTFDGMYKACNRYGLESSASPLQQMTFETTMKFLNSATLRGNRDQLKSPSSRLAVGHVVCGGTGSFDLLQPLVQAKKG